MYAIYQWCRRFLLKDPFFFDTDLSRKTYMRMHWLKQHESLCNQLASTKADAELMAQLPPGEVVNERESTSQINGKTMMMKVTAKEALEIDQQNEAVFIGKIEVLEKLLSQK